MLLSSSVVVVDCRFRHWFCCCRSSPYCYKHTLLLGGGWVHWRSSFAGYMWVCWSSLRSMLHTAVRWRLMPNARVRFRTRMYVCVCNECLLILCMARMLLIHIMVYIFISQNAHCVVFLQSMPCHAFRWSVSPWNTESLWKQLWNGFPSLVNSIKRNGWWRKRSVRLKLFILPGRAQSNRQLLSISNNPTRTTSVFSLSILFIL